MLQMLWSQGEKWPSGPSDAVIAKRIEREGKLHCDIDPMSPHLPLSEGAQVEHVHASYQRAPNIEPQRVHICELTGHWCSSAKLVHNWVRYFGSGQEVCFGPSRPDPGRNAREQDGTRTGRDGPHLGTWMGPKYCKTKHMANLDGTPSDPGWDLDGPRIGPRRESGWHPQRL